MTTFSVAHIDADQYRFLRDLVLNGEMEAAITIQRVAPRSASSPLPGPLLRKPAKQ